MLSRLNRRLGNAQINTVLCLLGLPCAERMVVLSNFPVFCCFPHYTSYRLGAWVINQNIYVSSLPVFAEPLLSVVVLESLRGLHSFYYEIRCRGR